MSGAQWACLVLILLGGLCASRGLWLLDRARSVRHWLPVDAIVLHCRVGTRRVWSESSTVWVYVPKTKFKYTAPSGDYVSDRFSIDPLDFVNLPLAATEQLVSSYRQGATVLARMHPTKNALAVLHEKTSKKRIRDYGFMMAFGVSAIMAGIFFYLPQ